jgi:hypothetical protein
MMNQELNSNIARRAVRRIRPAEPEPPDRLLGSDRSRCLRRADARIGNAGNSGAKASVQTAPEDRIEEILGGQIADFSPSSNKGCVLYSDRASHLDTLSLTYAHLIGRYAAQGVVLTETKKAAEMAVEKTLRGKVAKQTFPPRLGIPQKTPHITSARCADEAETC